MDINKLIVDFEESNKKLLYDDDGGLTELGKFALMGLAVSIAVNILDRLFPGVRPRKK